ncbi:HAD-IIIC family phosphatase [Parashewanella tropica]|uniref:HAD-IIIC family phosphatase n=1 Tax=Parashewanella tropica TaxID=2547970 RepID=UPI0010599F62|nr:HAD-IIIC family phosphatase [Parashewanella tropica]
MSLSGEKIKLIIWDLDETFWKGTLSEEGIEVIEQNIAILKELTDRGVVNSISSKNDFQITKKKLQEIGVWDYFVFPKISWQPKGQVVKDTITEMGLRSVNCLFLDDNSMNLREVEDFCPGIQTSHPDDILSELLDLDVLKGKDDRKHTRLNQYKILEKKTSVKADNKLSNIEFLMESEIKVCIDYKCEEHMDRIVELVNRSNQLNYTKKRILTDFDKSKFQSQLDDYRTSAAVIKCKDKYGDYGIIGFYMLITDTIKGKSLEHFVFSCRTMNMGIESFLFNYLGKPKIETVEPVSYEINTYEDANWVSLVESFSNSDLLNKKSKSVILVGPCHLLQASNFIHDSIDYVHYHNGTHIVKYDCPGFFLNKKEKVETAPIMDKELFWTKSDFNDFHEQIRNTDILVLSLDDLLNDYWIIEEDGLMFRCDSGDLASIFNSRKASSKDKLQYIDEIIKRVLCETKEDSDIYLLDSVFNSNTPRELMLNRLIFSYKIKSYSSNRLHVINMKSLLVNNDYGDGIHLDRKGYYKLSEIILDKEHSSETVKNSFDDEILSIVNEDRLKKEIYYKCVKLKAQTLLKLKNYKYLYRLLRYFYRKLLLK